MIEESVALVSEVVAVAEPADAWSAQGMGDAGSQQSKGGGGVCQEEVVEGVEVGPCAVGQKTATVAEVVAVAARGQTGDDVMEKIEEMMEKLRTKNLSLHCEPVSKRAAHARALMDIIRLQRDRRL